MKGEGLLLLQWDNLGVCTRTIRLALPWGEGLTATRELFLLAAPQDLLGGCLSAEWGVIYSRVGVLHVPHALTPGAFAPWFLLPWGQKPSTL